MRGMLKVKLEPGILGVGCEPDMDSVEHGQGMEITGIIS